MLSLCIACIHYGGFVAKYFLLVNNTCIYRHGVPDLNNYVTSDSCIMLLYGNAADVQSNNKMVRPHDVESIMNARERYICLTRRVSAHLILFSSTY